MTTPEGEEQAPQPPRGHVRMIYKGPVAEQVSNRPTHWEAYSDFGDPAVVGPFVERAMARLVLLPAHDPQFRRNRERIVRDAERENLILEWDLGVPEDDEVQPG